MDASARSDKSSKGERTRTRKISPANSDKSEKRKSRSMDKAGRGDRSRRERRSPRRTITEPSERQSSPKPIRRQKSTPSSVLEEGLLVGKSDGQAKSEEEPLKALFGKASTSPLVDDDSDNEDDSKNGKPLRRRRSKGLLDDGSNRGASSSRRTSSGKRLDREVGDTKTTRKDLSPKRSSRSKIKE